MSIKISGIIITFNEELNIEGCIDSLKGVVDEIIVVDSFSNDKTRYICEAMGVNFVQKKWEGYSSAKNWGNSLSKGDFILSIDADERLSEELKKSIKAHKEHLEGTYSFNRLTNYCGKWIRNGGWYPDKKTRIFPKEGSFWNDNAVHEKLIVKSPIKETFLEGDLLHYSYRSIESHISKINTYTTIEAEEAYKAGKRVNYAKWIFSPFFKFFKIFIFHRAFMDGFHGFLIASFSSYSKFIKYGKLKQLQFNNSKK